MIILKLTHTHVRTCTVTVSTHVCTILRAFAADIGKKPGRQREKSSYTAACWRLGPPTWMGEGEGEREN